MNIINTITRDKCLLSNSTDLETLYTFKNFPIYCGCVDLDSDVSEDLFSDMIWQKSLTSGNIQLKELIPLDILYSRNHNPGSIGKTWIDHHKRFSNFIKGDSYKNVLEIGGSTGNLFKNFIDETEKFSWNVLEPSGAFASDDSRVNCINNYFEEHDFKNNKFDTVIHSHVLEHTYEPVKFVSKISSILDDGGLHYVSIPNMKHWLQSGFTNALFFEHTFFINLEILKYILSLNNFVIERTIITDHSIFVKSRKCSNLEQPTSQYLHTPEKIFSDYIEHLNNDLKNLNNILDGEDCFLFGAHVFSQTLFSMGLKFNVKCILDNDKDKQGKRLYGTNLTVKDASVISDYKYPKVVVRAGVYNSEIKDQLLKINSNVKIY